MLPAPYRPNWFHVQIDASSPITQIDFDINTGFQATGVRVSNYSCYWIYFLDADTYVPPFYVDYVLILKHTTSIQYFKLASPADPNPTVPQAWSSPSYFISLEFTDNPNLTFARGVSVGATQINIITPPINVNVVNNNPVNVNIVGSQSPPIDVNIPQELDVEVTNTPLPVTVVGQVSTGPSSFQSLTLTTILSLAPLTRVTCPTTAMVGRLALMLQAAPDNTGVIYIGGIGVTADETATGGVQILAGQSLPIDASDNDLVYAITGVAGQKLIVIEAK